ncbi:MAG: SDR family oxidoreductase [Rickettsiales bacterium]|nr:SDR family oxidoreductase [Rickettsiales bacterium]
MRIILVVFLFCISRIVCASTIVVATATGEFGQAVCAELASSGHDLIIVGRNSSKLGELAKSLKQKHKKISVKSAVMDFNDLETIKNVASDLKNNSINGLVLIGPRPSIAKNTIPDSKEWLKLFQEGFFGPLELLKQFDTKLEKGAGIVIISGLTSKYYIPQYSNSNVLRMAWIGEIKNLIYLFKDRNIRVNAISPGVILTSFHKERIQNKAKETTKSFEEQLQKETQDIPLQKFGTVTDVAHLVGFLLSHKASHINGDNLVLDGGESRVY